MYKVRQKNKNIISKKGNLEQFVTLGLPEIPVIPLGFTDFVSMPRADWLNLLITL